MSYTLEDKVLSDKGETHQERSTLESEAKTPTVVCSCFFSSMCALGSGLEVYSFLFTPSSLGYLTWAHGFRYQNQQYAGSSHIGISNPDLCPELQTDVSNCQFLLTCLQGTENSTYPKLSSCSSYQHCSFHIPPSSLIPPCLVSTVAIQVQVPFFCGCISPTVSLTSC